ncbi:MAG: DNA translocase FtsK [Solirubrobacterales bacterium]
MGNGEHYSRPSARQAEDKTPLESAIAGDKPSADQLYDRAVVTVRDSGKASVSYLQRKLHIGYNAAAALVERMEREGLVSRPDNVGRRELRTAMADYRAHLDEMDDQGIGVSISVAGGPQIPLNKTAAEQVH